MARPAVAAPPCVARRHALAAALAITLTGRPRRAAAAVDDAVAALLPPAFRPTGRVLTVSPDTNVATVLATARDGDAVVLGPGEHRGRAVLERRVAVIGAAAAAPGAATTAAGPGAAPTTCSLRWTTTAPYESTIAARAPGCIVTGLTIAHASPSVANNYAVFVEGGADGFTLSNCAVTSATGTGVGIDAATAALDHCTITGCARYSVAVFGDGARIVDCVIDGNKAGGVLVRAAAGVAVAGGARQRVEVVGGGEAVVDGVLVVG